MSNTSDSEKRTLREGAKAGEPTTRSLRKAAAANGGRKVLPTGPTPQGGTPPPPTEEK